MPDFNDVDTINRHLFGSGLGPEKRDQQNNQHLAHVFPLFASQQTGARDVAENAIASIHYIEVSSAVVADLDASIQNLTRHAAEKQRPDSPVTPPSKRLID